MAGKKQPSIQDALKYFQEVMLRASLSNYTHVNRIMCSKNPKEKTILIIPEIGLWNSILDSEMKEKIKELDSKDKNYNETNNVIHYGETINDDWFDIDTETLYQGKIVKIKIDGYEYDFSINRDCLPLKLKKAEYNEIKYKVFTLPYHVLAIKKYFPFPISDYGFTMMRLFQII